MPNNSEGGVEKLTEEKHEVTSNFNIIQICNTDWFFLLKHPSDRVFLPGFPISNDWN